MKSDKDGAILANLLARVHRDGGHYVSEHGVSKAVEEADTIIAKLYATERAVPENRVDEIVTRLYRRFKEWSARGFGPDDVTWCEVKADVQAMLAAERAVPKITGDTSDGYHTFNELYEFRKVYNAALFNEWAAAGKHGVHKSWRHHDGEECFGGGWFIVVAMLPTGQISNHYAAEDWGLFNVPECERAKFEFDGHTSEDVLLRLKTLAAAPGAGGAK